MKRGLGAVRYISVFTNEWPMPQLKHREKVLTLLNTIINNKRVVEADGPLWMQLAKCGAIAGEHEFVQSVIHVFLQDEKSEREKVDSEIYLLNSILSSSLNQDEKIKMIKNKLVTLFASANFDNTNYGTKLRLAKLLKRFAILEASQPYLLSTTFTCMHNCTNHVEILTVQFYTCFLIALKTKLIESPNLGNEIILALNYIVQHLFDYKGNLFQDKTELSDEKLKYFVASIKSFSPPAPNSLVRLTFLSSYTSLANQLALHMSPLSEAHLVHSTFSLQLVKEFVNLPRGLRKEEEEFAHKACNDIIELFLKLEKNDSETKVIVNSVRDSLKQNQIQVVKKSVDNLTRSLPTMTISLTKLKMANMAPLEFIKDASRRGFSPLSMLDVLQTWHDNNAFNIDERFYISVLNCMGPKTVFPSDVDVLFRVMEAMRMRGVKFTSNFYSKFIDVISEETVENKEMIIQAIPDTMLRYCSIIFNGQEDTWIEALALYLNSTISQDEPNKGFIQRLRMLNFISDNFIPWPYPPSIATEMKWNDDCPSNFVIRHLQLPDSYSNSDASIYKTSFECLSKSFDRNNIHSEKRYISEFGLRRQPVWDGSNHAGVAVKHSNLKDLSSEECISLLEESGAQNRKLNTIDYKNDKANSGSFINKLANRWKVMCTKLNGGYFKENNWDDDIDDISIVSHERVRFVWNHLIDSGITPDLSTCTMAIKAHSQTNIKHSLVLLSALSIFEHALSLHSTSENIYEINELYSEMISCAFRHENNRVADALLSHMISKDFKIHQSVAITFLDNLGGKAPQSNPIACFDAYIGFTQSLGVKVSSRMIDSVMCAATQFLSYPSATATVQEEKFLYKAINIMMKDSATHGLIPATMTILSSLRGAIRIRDKDKAIEIKNWAEVNNFIQDGELDDLFSNNKLNNMKMNNNVVILENEGVKSPFYFSVDEHLIESIKRVSDKETM